MRKLERSLNLFDVVAISIGAMLGGEIFVLPAAAAQVTGPSVWLCYLVAALLVTPAALSKSELATAMPESGGAYVYIERALGPLAGTVAGLGLWLSLLLKSAFALAIVGVYLAVLAPAPSLPVALSLLAGVTTLNILGVRRVGRAQTVVVGICLASLAVLIAVGLGRPAAEAVPGPWMSNGAVGFLSATGLVFISYAGVTKIAAVAEEVHDVERNVPRGILISLSVMTLVYTLIAAVLVDVLSPAALQADDTPLATLAGHLAGRWGESAIAVVAVLALVGMANAGLLAASRFPLAMSRDGIMPPALQRVSRQYTTPVTSIVLTAAMMAAMLATLDVIGIAKLASAFMIAAFCAVNASVVILRESRAHWYQPAFRAPGYPYVQLIGMFTGLALLVSMGTYALGGIAAGAFGGLVLYGLYARKRVSRLGALRKMAARRDLLAEPRRTGSFATVAAPTCEVMLLGDEPSAEAMVHLGLTLAGGERTRVQVVREVPEQTDLSTLAEVQDERMASLQRRVLALGEERHVGVSFDVVYTRDLRATLFESASKEGTRWAVLGWRDRAAHGMIVRNPLGWLKRNLPCNVAVFRDAGIRTYRKIMALAEPGPHDALVARTADDLARLFRAETTFVRFVPSDAPESAVEDVRRYHAELGRLCRQEVHSEIIRGRDATEAVIHASARFDLVVLGAPPKPNWRERLLGADEDRIMAGVHCAALRLGAPRLDHHAALQSAPETEASMSTTGAAVLMPARGIVHLSVASKDALFAALGRIFAEVQPTIDAAAITTALQQRERMQNTALSNGIALPHCSVESATRTRFVAITLARPIAYDAPDDGKVDVVLCLVGPKSDRETHLRLLRHLARLLALGGLGDALRGAKDEDTMHETFLDAADKATPAAAEA